MKNLSIFILVMILFMLSGCTNSDKTDELNNQFEYEGTIKIGSKYFTEQLLLTKITAIFLQEHGIDVKEVNNMGSLPLRDALVNGQVDLYWEYTGTALVVHQGYGRESDPQLVYDLVKETDRKHGLIWLEPSTINNSYVILMRKERAEELQIESISDFAHHMNDLQKEPLTFATQEEFYQRDDGLYGLQKHYGFSLPNENILKMDLGVLYHVLIDGQTDASIGFATDGRIRGFDLMVIEDDQSFFSPYYAAPVLREDIYSENIKFLLNQLSSKLTIEEMISLNYAVDVEFMDISEVSRNWLKEQGLIE